MALGRIAIALQSVASVAFVAAGGHQLFPRAARCASWRVALREIPNGLALAAMLGLVGIARISLWQYLGFYDYGEHWMRDHWCVLGGIKPALLTAAGVAPNVPPSC